MPLQHNPAGAGDGLANRTVFFSSNQANSGNVEIFHAPAGHRYKILYCGISSTLYPTGGPSLASANIIRANGRQIIGTELSSRNDIPGNVSMSWKLPYNEALVVNPLEVVEYFIANNSTMSWTIIYVDEVI